MKKLLILSLILAMTFTYCLSQTSIDNIGGTYDWAGPGEGDPWGKVLIHPKNDTSFSFFLKSSSGSGQPDIIIGKAIKIDKMVYEYCNSEQCNCKILFKFHEHYVYIKTDEKLNDCSGKTIKNLVENFMKINNEIPESFIYQNEKIEF